MDVQAATSASQRLPDVPRELNPDRARGSSRFFTRLPAVAWVCALVAALVHMGPIWYAQSQARGEWQFTGNVTVSPDNMQYRVWERQSLREGPIVTNRFTIEPNRPHLPIFFFYATAKMGQWLRMSPELAYQYIGMLFAFLLTLLIFVTVRFFFPQPHQTWWTFGVIMVGGGLGAYLKLLQQLPNAGLGKFVHTLLDDPLSVSPAFEDYRAHYVFLTLFDSLSLFIWVVALGMILAMYLAIERPTVWRVSICAVLLGVVTIMHVHEGITLVAIAMAVTLCNWKDPEKRRRALGITAVCVTAVLACYGYLGWLYSRSGMPWLPRRANPISVLTLLMAYPVAWGLIAWGVPDYWRRATYRERFLVGWALACTAITLGGPFHPFPYRGTLTYPIVLYLIAAGIFFARWPRVRWRAAAVALVLLGGTVAWRVAVTLKSGGFRTDAPYRFVNASERRVIASLATRSDTTDVLLAHPADELWLAPEYSGRLYVGHFFLTPDFRERRLALEHALAEPEHMTALLTQAKATRLYVSNAWQPQRFEALDGLTVMEREPEGWLFAVRRAEAGSK